MQRGDFGRPKPGGRAERSVPPRSIQMAGKLSKGYRRGLENFSSTGNEEEEHYMIEVTLQEGDRLDWALKSFKKKVEKSGPRSLGRFTLRPSGNA